MSLSLPRDVASADRAVDRRVLARAAWPIAVLYAALAVAALYPVFSVTVPPLVDYPNHLARMHILAHWEEVPALQQNYVIRWTLHPNMAMDLIVPLLGQFMSIYVAGKLFIAVTLLSILGGTMALRKTLHGKVGLWPVLTFLVLYNHALFWGFLNCLFATGLALFAFAGWIALREKPASYCVGLFSGVAVLLYVCHIFGLLVYATLVFGFEIWRLRSIADRGARRWPEALVAAVQFALPAVLFLSWIAGNVAPGPSRTVFGAFADRAVIFLTPVHFNMPWLDIVTLAFLGMVWILARFRGTVGISAPLKIPLLLLAALAFVMPVYLYGVWGTHIRLPFVIVCVLIAGTQFHLRTWRPMPVVVGAAIALFLLRTSLIADQWRDIGGRFDEFRSASAVIEPGATLLTVQDDEDLPAGRSPLYGKQYWHMNALAVIERAAFVPTLFTGHTLIDGSEAVKHLETPVGNPVSRRMLAMGIDASKSRYPLGYQLDRYMWLYFIGWPEQFDYLLSIRFDNTAPLYPDRVHRIAVGTFFDIGRVR